MYKAMVMSAGVGSRLEPLTKSVPKPLITIANKPVMDILLENLQSIGVKDVIANTYYLSEQIVTRYIKNKLGMLCLNASGVLQELPVLVPFLTIKTLYLGIPI